MVIHMATDVAGLLDKAISIHRLSSDYKLALVMGISASSLTSYRHGKTLPDARVIGKLCELTGDDPALLLAEIEAQRAKTDEARALWLEVVQRLQSTLHVVILSALFGGALWGGFPMETHAKTPESKGFQVYTSGNIRQAINRHTRRLRSFVTAILGRFFWGIDRVPCPASTAHA
jgi:transcriptional regulator with XRE-family HTH domain